VSFDAKQLRTADYVVAGGTVLYLVMAILPWVDVAHYLGIDLPGVDTTVSGFAFSGLVTFSFVLFLLAAVWAVLPAFTDVPTGFPRRWVTVGLCVLGFVLTSVAWIRSLGYGFQIWALLGLLAAAGIAVVAFLALLPELRNGPGLPARPAGGAQRDDQRPPGFPAPYAAEGDAAGQPPAAPPDPRQATQQYGRPPAPPPGPAPGYPPPAGSPGQPAAGGPYGAPERRIPGHGVPEPGIPGQGLPEPGVPGQPGTTPPYRPPSGASDPGEDPPTTWSAPPDTTGGDPQRPQT
jgi:hypothetical protein